MATTCLSPHTLASIRKGKVAFRSQNCRLHVGVWWGRCRGAFDRGTNHGDGRFCRSRGQSVGFDLGRPTCLDRIAATGTLDEDHLAIRLDTREAN
jgi:hypothetical protein